MASRVLDLFAAAFGVVLLQAATFAQLSYEPYGFVTVAGNARYGSRDGVGSAARFNNIRALTTDKSGNLYAVDGPYDRPRVRKITPDALVTTIAGGAAQGNQDGYGADASFSSLTDVSAGEDGNVYGMDRSPQTTLD